MSATLLTGVPAGFLKPAISTKIVGIKVAIVERTLGETASGKSTAPENAVLECYADKCGAIEQGHVELAVLESAVDKPGRHMDAFFVKVGKCAEPEEVIFPARRFGQMAAEDFAFYLHFTEAPLPWIGNDRSGAEADIM